LLYAERNIQIESLKNWCNAIDINQVQDLSDHEKEAMNAQLLLFKSLVSKLKMGDDWRIVQEILSPRFYDMIFKASDNAIHIANYYECFVTPSDIQTKKRIIAGYSDYLTVGEIQLYDGRKRVGSLGVKSDLLWSVFYNYFVVESELGSVDHTLSNHEEFMSLQLWNVEGKSVDEINCFMNNILLNISIKHGLNFKKAYPNELWRSRGLANIYGVQVKDDISETIPLSYLNFALTCDNARVAYLHCYQVLEYFFVRAQNKELLSDLSAFTSISTINDSDLRLILRDYTNSLKERASLKLVLQYCVDIAWVKSFVTSNPVRIQQYMNDTSLSTQITLKLDSGDEKFITRLSERIYFFRCAIAHAKGDVNEYLALPELSDITVKNELPLLTKIALRALQILGK